MHGPTVAYVDDAEAMAAQLKQLIPSLQHVLADVLHVMKRVYETLTARHAKTGECPAMSSLQPFRMACIEVC